MPDPRFLRASARKAHVSQPQPGLPMTQGDWQRITAPLCSLNLNGRLARQLPHGTRFCVIDRDGAAAFGFSATDGHCGWVDGSALGADHAPTHQVSALGSHVLDAADLKARVVTALPIGALLEGVQNGRHLETALGFVPMEHLRALDRPLADPVAQARRLLGVPYLWGGNSAQGIDCSGLVQLTRGLCGLPTPPDSDLQQAMAGTDVAQDALEPRDLVFWRGHVAMVSAPGTILHANAHHMRVTEEPLTEAIARIDAAGGGQPTRFLRPA